MPDLGGALTALESVAEMAGALLVGLGLLAGFFIAYLVVRTHGAGYAPFTLRRVLTWYSRAVMLVAIVLMAGAAANLLSVLSGTVFGDRFTVGAHESPNYGLTVARSAFAIISAAVVYIGHQRLRVIFDPAPGDRTARRFLVAATAVLFGVGSFALLMQADGAVIRHIDAGVNHGAGPDMLLSGLIVALIFVRRELAESG
jgi:hypothetical protein